MRHILLFSALLVGATAPTYADTTFNLTNNMFSNGAVANGTVQIDTVTGVFDSLHISLVSGANTYVFTGAPAFQSSFDNGTQYYAASFDGAGDELVIDVPGASLMGYAGGPLCSTSQPCDGLVGAFAIPVGPMTANVYSLSTGSLTAQTPLSAQTPEPSSLLLLGSGMIGVAGAVRRRLTGATA